MNRPDRKAPRVIPRPADRGPRLPWRRPLWWGLVLGVLLLHVLIGQEIATGFDLGGGRPPPAPIDVAFVREMTLAAPVTAAAAAAPPVAAAPAVVAAPASSASAPQPAPGASAARAAPSAPAGAASVPQEPAGRDRAGAASATPPPARVAQAGASAAASAVPPEGASALPVAVAGASAASGPGAAASGGVVASLGISQPPPAPSAAAAGAGAAFDWPPSTRLDYSLLGHFRGPLHGSARVEWRRQGERYQVQVTVSVLPAFERRMISDGLLGPSGLMPRRYDEETDVPLRGTRRNTVLLGADGGIQLANGRSAEAPPGVQDSASQFVQMTWLFLTQPQRLKVGSVVQFPLALPRRVGIWTYDVSEQVTLALPFGNVEAFHLSPRLTGTKPNELSVQMWMAPGLQYLPVKLRIQQDEETHLELTLKKPPVQATVPVGS